MLSAAFVDATLSKAMAEVARDALERPSGHDSFDYGRVVGLYAGLRMAKQKLLDTLKDAEEKGNDL